jgi:hypothetical protein
MSVGVRLGPRPTSELGPFLPQQRTFGDYCGMSEKCQRTKSLRSSPLRGGKNREAGSQLRGQRWRV